MSTIHQQYHRDECANPQCDHAPRFRVVVTEDGEEFEFLVCARHIGPLLFARQVNHEEVVWMVQACTPAGEVKL